MSNEDTFESFRRAFEEQRSEIQRIYNRVSKLEQANTEVLAYVRRTGNLPVLDNESLKSTVSQNQAPNITRLQDLNSTLHDSMKHRAETNASVFADLRGSDEEVSMTNSTDLNSDLSSNSAFLSARTSEHCTPELSTIIGQQTKEIEKSLNNLNLDPTKRMQIVNQIQSNLSAILYSQLALSETDGVEQGVKTIDVNKSNPSTSKALGSPKIPQLFYGDGSTLGGFQLPIDSAGQLYPHSGQDLTLADQTDCPTPVNPPALSDMHEKRRQALHRANQRMNAPMHLQNLVHMDPTKGPTMVTLSSLIPVPQGPVLPTTRAKANRGSLPGSGDENYANPFSALHALNATEYAFLKKAREFSCPCGNEKTCPLHPVKQYRFATDRRVTRGFTLLVAVFRGRFVRQLLATHKVFDLIRTVKDSAKLALSIHAERSASAPKQLEFEPPTTKTDRLSNEELALESRLLSQLRGALAQLHEIFFTWSLASQIELLNISRSKPQRNKKLPTKSEDSHSVNVHSDPFADSWTSRGPGDHRYGRNANGNQWSSRHYTERSAKLNRRRMEKIDHSGSSSLTKLIDSVRRSWPNHPKIEHKKSYSISVASLAALAYDDNNLTNVKQSNQEAGDQPTQMLSKVIAPLRSVSQSDQPQTTSDVQYTPVRLYTPPPPEQLHREPPIPNSPSKSHTPSALHPQPGHASLFHLHQLSQHLRIERQTLNVFSLSSETLTAFCPRFSRSQQRCTQLHHQKVLLTRRSGSESILTGRKSRPLPYRIDPLKVKLKWITKKPFGSNNHHPDSWSQSRERSLSSPHLEANRMMQLKQTSRSTPTLTASHLGLSKEIPLHSYNQQLKETSPTGRITPIGTITTVTEDRSPDRPLIDV